MRTRLVVKLIAVLVLLLAVVLYKMNDFYKQEKLFQAESLVQKQIQSIKTSVSSQLVTVRNVLSSFEVEIVENQINWVQLDPFFGLARLQKNSRGQFEVLQFMGRSGTMGEKWNKEYLERALSAKKASTDSSTIVRLFKDKNGGKYMAVLFSSSGNKYTAAFGSADYFQKYFDIERGGRMTSALMTTENVLAAHSESEYVATVSEEAQLSPKKYIIEKQQIAGTNLVALSYTLRKAAAAAWVVPWSVVGLIMGFGCILIGLLFYGLDPLDKKIERYKKQERENIFKETVQSELKANAGIKDDKKKVPEIHLVEQARKEAVEKAQEAFAEPEGELAEATLAGPLQQALFNLDSIFKNTGVQVEKSITTRMSHTFHYGLFIKAFENILKNAVEALENRPHKQVSVRAYDVEDEMTVIEVQDNGVGLGTLKNELEKVWQPFFTTKPKSMHMGLGLTEALSTIRRCNGDLLIEPLTEGVLVKMIMKNEKVNSVSQVNPLEAAALEKAKSQKDVEDKKPAEIDFSATRIQFDDLEIDPEDLQLQQTIISDKTEIRESTVESLDLDIEQVFLDEIETEEMFTPQKINVGADALNGAGAVSGAVSAKSIGLKAPQFSVNKKSYKIDQFKTQIRRPEKS